MTKKSVKISPISTISVLFFLMSLETILTDALAHAGAGVALSFADYLSSQLTNPKAARLQRKQACLQSIEAILDSEGDAASSDVAESRAVPKESVEYAEHVARVQSYLRSSGLVKLQAPLMQRIKDGVLGVVRDEKINNLSNTQKLGVAAVAEITYEFVFGFYHATQVLKQSPAAAVAANLYQIPAFWVGLWLGNALKKFVNLIVTPSEEKQCDRLIRQLLDETKIVQIIVAYQPPEALKNGLAERGLSVSAAQLTRVGQGAFAHLKQMADTAKGAADDVLHFQEKQAEKERQAQEDRRKRFDDLTKGR